MGSLIAILNKKSENTAETAIAMLKALSYKNAEAFGIASRFTVKIEKHVDALQNTNINSPITIGYVFSKILPQDKPQPTKLENATLVFEGRTYPHAAREFGIKQVAEKLQRNHEETAKAFIQKVKGDFALVIAESQRLIAGRDPIGARPFYYGETAHFAALASECKALWKIGVKQAESFPPGHIAFVNKHGFKFKPIKTLSYAKPKQTTMQAAVKQLRTLLERSVEERVWGLKEVAVAFSGGLDSSIIAYLVEKARTDAHLIHVSLEHQPETEDAKCVAEELKLPISIYTYNEESVQSVLPKALWLIEESDPVKASVGIPIIWTAKRASENGFKVMLAGQGADELFGGYKRYLDDYVHYGEEFVQEKMFNDITQLYKANLERDSKICNFCNIELRLPFASFQLANFASSLPLKLKLASPFDQLRKIVLRKAAESIGLLPRVVCKPKKAIQYATGVNKALNRLAKSEGLPLNAYLEKTIQATLKKMM